MIAIRQLEQIRQVVQFLADSVSEEELFHRPAGFSNHIAWNAAHVVVTQQILCYQLAGERPYLADELIGRYRKGSGPDTADTESYRAVMAFLHEAPRRLAEDLEAGRCKRYQEYKTSAGIVLTSIEDAILFNNFHEGIHVGYIMALRKAVAAERS